MTAEQNRIVMCCKLPPPYNGQTIASKLFAGLLGRKRSIKVIDTSIGVLKPEGTFSLFRFYVRQTTRLARSYIRLYRCFQRGNVYYYIASPSVTGHFKNLVGILLVGRKASRIVAHVHNGDVGELKDRVGLKGSVSWLVTRTDVFIFPSQMLADRAEAMIESEKCVVVPNTVDEMVRCSRDEVERAVDKRYQSAGTKVVFLSNMIRSKGFWDVARAVFGMPTEIQRSIELHFVGEWQAESQREEFLSYIRQTSTKANVKIHGPVLDRKRIKEMLLASHVLALPTYYRHEAQPLCLIEALNAGTPVIATDHAAIPEFVRDDINGYIVPPRRPDKIADSLLKFLDKDNWREKARASRRTYLKRFSAKAIQKRLYKAVPRVGESDSNE